MRRRGSFQSFGNHVPQYNLNLTYISNHALLTASQYLNSSPCKIKKKRFLYVFKEKVFQSLELVIAIESKSGQFIQRSGANRDTPMLCIISAI